MQNSRSQTHSENVIRVLLVECPEKYIPAIRYTFEEIMVRIGYPISLGISYVEGSFDLQYGGSDPQGGIPHIPFNESCYDPTVEFSCSGTPHLWSQSKSEHSRVDLVGGMFRLLAMLDETQISDDKRDRKGIFRVDALPKKRKDVSDLALVENHTKAFLDLLNRSDDVTPPFPLWPNGAKWSLVLTHDTDAVRSASAPELIFNASKAVLRRDSVRWEMFKNGLKNRKKPFNEDMLNGFESWKNVTYKRNIRSAFYLYVRSKVKADINDCRSSVADPKMNWDPLKAMLEDGWEFGYHPSIQAKNNIDEFIESKYFIESKLGSPIYGLRHHYWALDWKNPHLTYRMHVNAGFRYDLSNAWRDAYGFRSGTCLPFNPWDPARKRGLDIYVLPTSLMDGHVIGETGYDGEGLARAKPVLNEVRRASGMAVLDWHTEGALNILCYEGHKDLACEIVDHSLKEGDVWVTTPWEIVKWWHVRRQELKQRSGWGQ